LIFKNFKTLKESGAHPKISSRQLTIIFIVAILFNLWFREAISLHPSYKKVFYHLGCEAQEKNRLGQAERYYKKAISLDPVFAPSYQQLGLVYEKKGDRKKAQEYYERAIIIDPSFSEALSDLGMLLLKENRFQEAISYFRRPYGPYAKAQYGLALAFLKLGQKENALDLLADLKSGGAHDLAKDLEGVINNSAEPAYVKP